MLIDRIYKKVKTFVNTEVRGNVTPAEFNLFLHDALQERQNEIIELINKHQNRSNKGFLGNGLENIAENYRQVLGHYLQFKPLVSNQNGQITLPEDLIIIDVIENDKEKSFEQCNNYNDFKILKPLATEYLPISIRFGNIVETYPVAINQNINISYIRKVVIPNWTYVVLNENELFNPSHPNFRDADVHPSEEDVLVVKVLKRFGINLKEEQLTAIASQTEQLNSQQELTS